MTFPQDSQDRIDHYRARIADASDPLTDAFPIAIAVDKIATELADVPGRKPGMEETYLGDGVYAAFDGYGVMLDLRGQDDTTRIYLEPAVMDALIVFKTRMRQKYQTGKDSPQ